MTRRNSLLSKTIDTYILYLSAGVGAIPAAALYALAAAFGLDRWWVIVLSLALGLACAMKAWRFVQLKLPNWRLEGSMPFGVFKGQLAEGPSSNQFGDLITQEMWLVSGAQVTIHVMKLEGSMQPIQTENTEQKQESMASYGTA